MDLTLSIIAAAVTICIGEFVLWKLFRRKIEGLMLPHSSDRSYLHFFTLGRVRFIAIVHTIVLVAVVVLSYLFLW